MAITYINTGTSANAGNGDSLRTAFWKINRNFLDVDGRLTTSTYSAGLVSPPTTSTSTGTIGQLSFSPTYFYACTGTNAWKRIAWDGTAW